ncbi:MAG: hypothetical protein HY246_25845 [Proteobacteria bacterium]|nr:hypothetical protein [Pseudomonadota bacterium]
MALWVALGLWAACGVLVIGCERAVARRARHGGNWQPQRPFATAAYFIALALASPAVIVLSVYFLGATLWRGMIPVIMRPWSLPRAIKYPENWPHLVGGARGQSGAPQRAPGRSSLAASSGKARNGERA